MLFKEYKKMYVEFCEEEIMREIVLAKRRYLRKEHKAVSQCVLNATDEYGNEKIEELKEEKLLTDDFFNILPIADDEISEFYMPIVESICNTKCIDVKVRKRFNRKRNMIICKKLL